MEPLLKDIVPAVVTGIAVLVAIFGLVVGIRSGILQRLRFGAFEIELSPRERQQARALIETVTRPDREPIAFETEQLAQYYSQVLAQSKVSFWFSLIFAS